MSLKIKQIDALQTGLDSKLESVNLSYLSGTRTISNTGGNNAILPLFSDTIAGLAPLSGGGTTNFLRADGTWAPAGAVISGTQNYIPIFNSTEDNIEDSILELSDNTAGVFRTHTLTWEGLNPTSANTTSFVIRGKDTETQGASLSVSYDGDFAGLPRTSAAIQCEPNTKIETFSGSHNLLAADAQVARVLLSNIPIVNFERRKSDGRLGTRFRQSSFIFAPGKNANRESFSINTGEGYLQVGPNPSYYPSGTDCVLKIYNENSGVFGYIDRPHIYLVGGFDEGSTTPNIGSIWKSSNDSKIYFRSSVGTNISIEDFPDITTAPSDGNDYRLIVNNGVYSWVLN